MTRWKLTRQMFGKEEFTISGDEVVTIGRGINNKICLSSIVISRNHCQLNVRDNEITITDLRSSNGVYVGAKKIPQNSPYPLKDSDIIGLGWIFGVSVSSLGDNEKFIFKLQKDVPALNNNENYSAHSPVLETKPNIKRKFIKEEVHIKEEIVCDVANSIKFMDDDIIDIPDSDSEIEEKKPKMSVFAEDDLILKPKEKEDIEYDSFAVKQEYDMYDDNPIEIDSDDDNPLILRMSQSSPGKALTPTRIRNTDTRPEECSYSQLDDFLDDDDLYIEPNIPPDNHQNEHIQEEVSNFVPTYPSLQEDHASPIKNTDQSSNNFKKLSINKSNNNVACISSPIITSVDVVGQDEIDGIGNDQSPKEAETSFTGASVPAEKSRKAQLIDPMTSLHRKKASTFTSRDGNSSRSSSKREKQTSKRHITESQKEERKRKLKEIASKKNHDVERFDQNSSKSRQEKATGVKVTSANRSAFLTDTSDIPKPTKKRDKENPIEDPIDLSDVVSDNSRQSKTKRDRVKHDDNKKTSKSSNKSESKVDAIKLHESSKLQDKTEDKEKSKTKRRKSLKTDDVPESITPATLTTQTINIPTSSELRVPLKSLKPLTENEDTFSGKPFSKVEPLTHSKPKKQVRFSDKVDIQEFQIEQGNKMKKTSTVKNMDIMRQAPILSLEKISLMKILRWNPLWLEEQNKYQEPPPILGHNNTPQHMFHTFTNHAQYVQMVGDLLLMEVWEYLTQGHIRLRGKNGINMVIESLPPIPTQERHFEIFNVSVRIPNSEKRLIPRMGEILIVDLGENVRRFFFVSNVKNLPPQGNMNVFGMVLHTCYTEKMRFLQQGRVIAGWSLAYIHKELQLFEAMEYLATSPLSEAILKPEPRHFVTNNFNEPVTSIYMKNLNANQQLAVKSSVSAALGDRPSIQMVQGPPGTGKSSVICAMVMSYYYNAKGKRKSNRGKILICATSNAAVDELVIRLLNVRQNLPKAERFRMVRVGRAEAMHPRALEVSSQTLAQRDAVARANADPPMHGAAEEMSHLQAKINMWKSQAQDPKAKPERVAYCQSQLNYLENRRAMVRNAGGGAAPETLVGEQLVRAERRIIEGADIVVTTLSSAQNHKMRGLKNRIALCVVDEAGQAIEPETLIPLTLGVTRMTLIGDPQQLPGFICSQRAKKHGLGASLFSRLTSYSETWPEPPLVLLNQQYRMHADIADYPNRAFYAGAIQTIQPSILPTLTIPPYSIISIASGDKGQVQGANQLEACAVARLAMALSAELREMKLNLAVITPYNAHKDLIKEYVKNMHEQLMETDPSYIPGPTVEVNTVDSFQGQERDVVIVSLARSQGVGFLTDAGRMNVMLTRAKHALLVCLNPNATIKNQQWNTLVEDAQNRHLLRVLPKRMFNQIMPNTISEVKEILTYVTYNTPKKSKK